MDAFINMLVKMIILVAALGLVTRQAYLFSNQPTMFLEEGDPVAFQNLVMACNQWSLYIDQCHDCDCDLCKSAFYKPIMPGAYKIPILLFTSGLVKEGNTVNAEDLTSESEFCSTCAPTGATFKCAEAAKLLIGTGSPLDADSAIIKKNLDDPTIKPKLTGDVEVDGKTTNYIGACAAVCNAITKKVEKCNLGADACIADPTKLP